MKGHLSDEEAFARLDRLFELYPEGGAEELGGFTDLALTIMAEMWDVPEADRARILRDWRRGNFGA